MGAAPTAKVWSDAHRKLVTDARYGHVYNNLCSRYYKRCNFWLNVFQLAAGAATCLVSASVLFGNDKGVVSPKLGAAGGGVLGVVALAAMQWQPAIRAEQHRVASNRFLELYGRGWNISTTQLARDLAAAQAAAPHHGPRGLEMPAFSRNVTFFGYPAED